MDSVYQRFIASLPPDQAQLAGQRADLAARVTAVCAAAVATVPGVVAEDLAAALAARVREADDLAETLGRLRAGDLALVLGCIGRQPDALQRFDAILSAEVDAGAASVRAPGGLAEEVKQRLREALLVGTADGGPGIEAYAGRGDLRSFLRITGVRECLRLMKRQRWEIGVDGDDLSQLAPAVDPELERLKETYRVPFTACFTEAITRLNPRERTLLRYHAIDRLSIDQIGAIYGAHRATAARWLERARARVAELTEELLAERLSLDAGEVASVIRLVRSQVDVSLARLLGGE